MSNFTHFQQKWNKFTHIFVTSTNLPTTHPVITNLRGCFCWCIWASGRGGQASNDWTSCRYATYVSTTSTAFSVTAQVHRCRYNSRTVRLQQAALPDPFPLFLSCSSDFPLFVLFFFLSCSVQFHLIYF